ncbi:MAG: hypothetical protein ACP5FH_01935 [Terracidiphilus sp.]
MVSNLAFMVVLLSRHGLHAVTGQIRKKEKPPKETLLPQVIHDLLLRFFGRLVESISAVAQDLSLRGKPVCDGRHIAM